jgi:hypothetical protein
VVIAGAAGVGAYLLVSGGASRPTAATPTPAPATATPLPLPDISAPAISGEPPIQPADCSGGSPPDAYTAAAFADICQVLTPLAEMDPACATASGLSCESAARALALAAEASLTDIRAQTPVTAAEKAADPELRTAFRDDATAGADLAEGIADGDAALAAKGLTVLASGTDALSAAGVDLAG